MKKLLLNGLVAVAMVTGLNAITFEAQAAATSVVSEAGVLRNGEDHFFEVAVQEEPLKRLRVQCVTFHELDSLAVFVDGVQVEPKEDFGFEEFALTFAEPIPAGQTVRVVMLNSRVQGRIVQGVSVPYRVFANYPSLSNDEFPLGTAIVRTTPKR
ncbi:hypothetical protein C1752_09725 [Acaryochloris thomasi RCC1774]|uniref:Uncharacterized protein n=1 Tax=Acaryochloris thomasi RCC1774 TaxID=1764569 RepID=A0A2W1JPD3_9CYAN|nr:hypothetical protein [Acaryochloris thomasi]PZD70747.1 hypothetical protein C1752_09725 [Acaryochloris thomasi RCC1774]